MFIYQVVGLGGVKHYESVEELTKVYKMIGIQEGSWLREELQGQPILEGLYGGMYNGVDGYDRHIIRYETPKAYEMYSR